MQLANSTWADLADLLPNIAWAFVAVALTTAAGLAAVAINRRVRRRLAPVKVRKTIE